MVNGTPPPAASIAAVKAPTQSVRNPKMSSANQNVMRIQFLITLMRFADDIFGFRTDWVGAFTAAIEAAGGGVPFTIQTRADLIGERMAQELKNAGLRRSLARCRER